MQIGRPNFSINAITQSPLFKPIATLASITLVALVIIPLLFKKTARFRSMATAAIHRFSQTARAAASASSPSSHASTSSTAAREERVKEPFRSADDRFLIPVRANDLPTVKDLLDQYNIPGHLRSAAIIHAVTLDESDTTNYYPLVELLLRSGQSDFSIGSSNPLTIAIGNRKLVTVGLLLDSETVFSTDSLYQALKILLSQERPDPDLACRFIGLIRNLTTENRLELLKQVTQGSWQGQVKVAQALLDSEIPAEELATVISLVNKRNVELLALLKRHGIDPSNTGGAPGVLEDPTPKDDEPLDIDLSLQPETTGAAADS